jgi:hypothetical protein
MEHIRGRYFPAQKLAEIKALSNPTRLEQQRIILKLSSITKGVKAAPNGNSNRRRNGPPCYQRRRSTAG